MQGGGRSVAADEPRLAVETIIELTLQRLVRHGYPGDVSLGAGPECVARRILDGDVDLTQAGARSVLGLGPQRGHDHDASALATSGDGQRWVGRQGLHEAAASVRAIGRGDAEGAHRVLVDRFKRRMQAQRQLSQKGRLGLDPAHLADGGLAQPQDLELWIILVPGDPHLHLGRGEIERGRDRAQAGRKVDFDTSAAHLLRERRSCGARGKQRGERGVVRLFQG